MRRALPMMLPFAVLLGCQVDLSFKAVSFDLDDRDGIFQAVKGVLATYFHGSAIYEQPEAGLMETDYIYKGGERMLREKVYVAITAHAGGTKVELLAIIEAGEVDVDSFNGVTWTTQGSDVRVEELLLRAITEKVGSMGLHVEESPAEPAPGG
ncbi:MAG: hypothetical protein AB1486_17510 [Planctomycetota bacterium]